MRVAALVEFKVGVWTYCICRCDADDEGNGDEGVERMSEIEEACCNRYTVHTAYCFIKDVRLR